MTDSFTPLKLDVVTWEQFSEISHTEYVPLVEREVVSSVSEIKADSRVCDREHQNVYREISFQH